MNFGNDALGAGVLGWFRFLSALPHGSGNEKGLSDALLARLRGLGWSGEQDALGNLRFDVPPTPGLEGNPLLLVQGHLDMVCAVRPGSGWDPAHDPVTPVVKDGWLRSDGRSSLGADNCLGLAGVLWLLTSGAPHGPVRLLCTVEEERGLRGAAGMDPRWLAGGKYLFNTDGFSCARAVIASAGGRREWWQRECALCPPAGTAAWRVTLSGFAGGHSGYDIGRGRGNPIRILADLLKGPGIELAALDGGHAMNALPMDASALAVCPGEELAALRNGWETVRAALPPEDRGAELAVAPAALPDRVWTAETKNAALGAVTGFVHGAIAWRQDFPQVPAASGNVGVARTEDGAFRVSTFLRCATAVWEAELSARQERLAGALGFVCRPEGGYAPWEGSRDNPMARRLAALYSRETGGTLEVSAVHVGLEPSVLLEKAPGLTAVNYGPTILDPHSVEERASLFGIVVYARLAAGLLARPAV